MRRGLSRNDPAGEQIAVVAVARYPDLNQAKEYLAHNGYNCVSEAALGSIKYRYAEDIEEAKTQLAAVHEQAIVNQARTNALQYAELEQVVLERLPKYLEKNPNADPSTIARNLSQAKAQNIDKGNLLEGRPTKRVEMTMPEFYEAEKRLRELGAIEDVTDAELVEDSG